MQYESYVEKIKVLRFENFRFDNFFQSFMLPKGATIWYERFLPSANWKIYRFDTLNVLLTKSSINRNQCAYAAAK